MKVGDLIDGKYRIVRLIGEGGMGAVYEVRHEVVGGRFALKTLHARHVTKESMVRRFIQEAQAASAIGSEHIILVTDGGRAQDGSPYIVMEYLEGEDLANVLIREDRLDQARAVELMLQVCEALSTAHERGIIHRDIKPANLFLTQRERFGEWVKVLDFGIAKVHQAISGQSRSLTKTGAIMGTPFFTSPEQFQKAKNVDLRADIYASGVTLYQLLSGRVPYDADNYEALIFAVATQAPMPLSTVLPGVDVSLEAVVMRSISKDAADRHQSMIELGEALRPFAAGEPVGYPQATTPPPAAQPQAAHAPAPEIPHTSHVEPSVSPSAPVPDATPATAPQVRVDLPPTTHQPTPSDVPPTVVSVEEGTREAPQVHGGRVDEEVARPRRVPPVVFGSLVGGVVVVGLAAAVALSQMGRADPAVVQAVSDASMAVEEPELGPAPRDGDTRPGNPEAPDPSLSRQPPLEPDRSIPDPDVRVPGEWVLIKAGSFTMGSPSSEPDRDNGEMQHLVTLTQDFLIQTNEVTQRQFLEVMGYNPSGFTSCGLDCPVERVSWHESAAYSNRLSERAGLGRCYSCNGSGRVVTCEPSGSYRSPYECPGYRLPTEAEWEYSAKAGTAGTIYGDLSAIAWFADNSGGTTHRVGQKRPNAWGLYDMVGNVWEWCHDWDGRSPSGAVTDPTGPGTGSYRVLRGGSWFLLLGDTRAAPHWRTTPGNSDFIYGFRPLRSR